VHTDTPTPSSWEQDVRDRLRHGDEAALGDLYQQFGGMVFGLARRVTRSEQAAEDVTQEVFLTLWERPETFDPSKGSLRAWLGTIAHRRSVDWVRREVARRERQRRDAAEMRPSPDIEEEVIGLAMAERVREALRGLPEEQRVAILLAYFEGQTYREVARTLGIPEGTAKSRMRLGLHRIANALEGEVAERWS